MTPPTDYIPQPLLVALAREFPSIGSPYYNALLPHAAVVWTKDSDHFIRETEHAEFVRQCETTLTETQCLDYQDLLYAERNKHRPDYPACYHIWNATPNQRARALAKIRNVKWEEK